MFAIRARNPNRIAQSGSEGLKWSRGVLDCVDWFFSFSIAVSSYILLSHENLLCVKLIVEFRLLMIANQWLIWFQKKYQKVVWMAEWLKIVKYFFEKNIMYIIFKINHR